MNTRKWFKPADGQTVLHPVTGKAVPPAGDWVDAHDEYFVRRELDGDGKLSDAPKAAKSKAD